MTPMEVTLTFNSNENRVPDKNRAYCPTDTRALNTHRELSRKFTTVAARKLQTAAETIGTPADARKANPPTSTTAAEPPANA